MRRRVRDEGLRIVNLFRPERMSRVLIVSGIDGTGRRSHGQLRASSRGNTEVASVTRNHWV
jgi:hypothetical protein